MYCLTINAEADAYRHIVAKVEWPHLVPGENGAPKRSLFLDHFCSASPLWLQVAPLSASLRIEVSPQRGPVTWHGLTSGREDDRILHQAVAALMRMDGLEGAVVMAPGDLTDFQMNYAGHEREWLALDTEPLSTSLGGQYFIAARIFDRLTTLLASAVAMGYELTYQAVLRPLRPHPDLLRQARKSAAFLQRQPGVPGKMAKAQADLALRIDDATLVVDEAVSISADGRDWLKRWLADNIADQSGVSYSAKSIVPLDADSAEAFENHLHPALLFGAPEGPADPSMVSRFWGSAEAAGLFRCDSLWRAGTRSDDAPPFSSLPIFFGNGGKPPPSGGSSLGGTLKAPPKGNDPFFFVSYAHSDTEILRPILDKIQAAGIPIWIDEQIKIGEEWDSRLETMITTSTGLLAFLSPKYVASKHCRRELKFADALDKDIFASALADFPLEAGFGYIFSSLQYATGSHDKVAESLAARLRERLEHLSVH